MSEGQKETPAPASVDAISGGGTEAVEDTTPSGPVKVLVSEEFFLSLGGDRVDWGFPDEDGFYSPTVLKDEPKQETCGCSCHGTVWVVCPHCSPQMFDDDGMEGA